MSQNDLVIDNQSFPATRADINSALQALGSLSSGSTAPTTTYANMLWYDTLSNILKVRSEADDAWISMGYLHQGENQFHILDDTYVSDTSGNHVGLLGDQSSATWEAGTSTTESLVSPAKVKASVVANSSGIGVSQTWQNLTGSRSAATSYQNTTGKPITVAVGNTGAGSFGNLDISTDNVNWITVGNLHPSTGMSAMAVVPNNHYYRLTNWNGTFWSELR